MDVERIRGCCAVSEIIHLSDHPTAKEALEEFLSNYSNGGYYDNNYRWVNGEKIDWTEIDAFIVFTGVEKTYRGAWHGIQKGYTKRFASYIKRHKLGDVTCSVLRRNRVNHPDHGVRVYTWAPSIQGLKKWAKKYMKED